MAAGVWSPPVTPPSNRLPVPTRETPGAVSGLCILRTQRGSHGPHPRQNQDRRAPVHTESGAERRCHESPLCLSSLEDTASTSPGPGHRVSQVWTHLVQQVPSSQGQAPPTS